MSPLRILDLPVDRVEGEVVAAFFFEDDRPLCGPAALLDWRLNGSLTEALVEGRNAGTLGEQVMVRSNGKIQSEWILFAGGGRRQDLYPASYGELVRGILDACLRAGFLRIALGLTPIDGMERLAVETMVAEVVAQIPNPRGHEVEYLLSMENKGVSHSLPRSH